MQQGGSDVSRETSRDVLQDVVEISNGKKVDAQTGNQQKLRTDNRFHKILQG